MIFAHELVGKQATVVKSTNPHCEGLQGVIVDETKNTLMLETKTGSKTLLKSSVTLRLESGEIIDCNTIIKRSHDRIKGKT